MALAAARIPEPKVRQPQRPACHYHARDLAARQRRDPPGRDNGRSALGVTGPIA
jgi:hypothetical protein